MIISHKYRFIFVKTYKTAGTSLEVMLSDVCPDGDVFTPIIPHVDPHRARHYRGLWNPIPELAGGRWSEKKHVTRQFLKRQRYYNHLPAEAIRQRTPRSVWDSYFKFCVERNPWDKVISSFHMYRSIEDPTLTLDGFLQNGLLPLNLPIYSDTEGKVLVDRVLKYENLSEELSRVFKELDMPCSGEMSVRAKGSLRSDKRHYSDVYTPEQRSLVADLFADEINLHGYAFDGMESETA